METQSNKALADQLFTEVVAQNPSLPTSQHATLKQACLMAVNANRDGGLWQMRQALKKALDLMGDFSTINFVLQP
jgi:hypothetical protein